MASKKIPHTSRYKLWVVLHSGVPVEVSSYGKEYVPAVFNSKKDALDFSNSASCRRLVIEDFSSEIEVRPADVEIKFVAKPKKS